MSSAVFAFVFVLLFTTVRGHGFNEPHDGPSVGSNARIILKMKILSQTVSPNTRSHLPMVPS